jgi:hypothetical protein
MNDMGIKKTAELQTELEDALDLTPNFEGDELFDTESDDFGSEIGVKPAAAEEKANVPEPEPEVPSTETEPDGNAVAPAAAAEPEPAPEPADREPRIPKSRFDQVNERRKAAEARLQELERAQKVSDPAVAAAFDFVGREKAYMEAVLDGEVDKALAIRTEIRAAEQALLDLRLNEARSAATEATKSELALKQTIDELQTQYPVFDGESESFNEDITNEALELFQAFQGQGYDPVSAMQRAVRYTVKLHDLDAPAVPAAPVKPASAAPAAPAPAQIRAKLDVATQQPPIAAGRVADRVPDVRSMPEEQFDKLSRQDEAVLRGDFI